MLVRASYLDMTAGQMMRVCNNPAAAKTALADAIARGLGAALEVDLIWSADRGGITVDYVLVPSSGPQADRHGRP